MTAKHTPISDDALMLYSMNTGGNVHETCSNINERLPELVPYLVQIDFNGGYHSVAVFKAPRSLIERLKAAKKIW